MASVSLTASGIDFSDYQTVGTGTGQAETSELMDHYEEGTWTPEFRGSTGSAGSANTTGTGTYTKLGRLVSLRVQMGITNLGSWTGYGRIYGFPFTQGSQTGNYGGTINVGYLDRLTFTDTFKGYGYPSQVYMRLIHDINTDFPVSGVDVSAHISFDCFYET